MKRPSHTRSAARCTSPTRPRIVLRAIKATGWGHGHAGTFHGRLWPPRVLLLLVDDHDTQSYHTTRCFPPTCARLPTRRQPSAQAFHCLVALGCLAHCICLLPRLCDETQETLSLLHHRVSTTFARCPSATALDVQPTWTESTTWRPAGSRPASLAEQRLCRCAVARVLRVSLCADESAVAHAFIRSLHFAHPPTHHAPRDQSDGMGRLRDALGEHAPRLRRRSARSTSPSARPCSCGLAPHSLCSGPR